MNEGPTKRKVKGAGLSLETGNRRGLALACNIKAHLALKLLSVWQLRNKEFGFAVEACSNDTIIEGFFFTLAIFHSFEDPAAAASFGRNALHLRPRLYGIFQLEMLHIVLDVLLGFCAGWILAPGQLEGKIQEFVELFGHLNTEIRIVFPPDST